MDAVMNMTMNTTMSMLMDMNSTGMTHHHHHHHMQTTGMPMDHNNHGDMNGNMGGSQDHSMHMHMGNGTEDECGDGMAMFFHTGKCEYLLFEGIQTKTVAEMVGACIIIFLLAVLYEGLKVFREYLLKKALVTGSKYQEVTVGANGQSIVADAQVKSSNGLSSLDYKPEKKQSIGNRVIINDPFTNRRISMISSSHMIQTLLHVLQVFISYCLMLVFMTYNAWLCIAVILGAGTGYFFFGWKRAVVVDVNEHCH